MKSSPVGSCVQQFWMGRVDCHACELAASMPMATLDRRRHQADLVQLGSYLLPAETPVILKGDPADAVFSVRSGFLKLWQYDDCGVCRIVRLLRPGDILGLEALFQPTYAHTATTLTRVRLCRIPSELLRRLERQEPDLQYEVQRRWHHQLQRGDEFMLSVVSGSSRERVLKLLRYLAKFAAPEPCPRIRRLDMAAMLQISSETAARVIADLKKAGLLEEAAAELRFDPQALHQAPQPEKIVNHVTFSGRDAPLH